MIRALQTEDISAVSAIWLNTNLSAHAFILSQYWEGQLSEVTEDRKSTRLNSSHIH